MSSSYKIVKQLHPTIYGDACLAELDSRQVVVKRSDTRAVRRSWEEQVKRTPTRGIIMENPLTEAALHRYVTTQLPHPHILKCLSEFEAREGDVTFHHMVLEYASGGDLFDHIMNSSQKCLPEHKARPIFHQVVQAVHHLHRFGVVHLDLSPENIFLDGQGQAKVADFGVAFQLPPQGNCQGGIGFQDRCPPTMLRSKAKYMCPELVYGRSFQATKADAFSLGVLLLLMLTGYHLFEPFPESFLDISRHQVGVTITRTGLRPHLSDEAFELICFTLAGESTRFSVDQILRHDFLRDI